MHLVSSGAFAAQDGDLESASSAGHEHQGLREGMPGEGAEGHPAWFLKGLRILYREAVTGVVGGGIKALVKSGIPVEGVGGKGGWLTPLHAAAKSGNIIGAKALLDQGLFRA